jgi:hypothetical protein
VRDVHQCRLGRRLAFTSQAPTIKSNAPTPTGRTVGPPVLANEPPEGDCWTWPTGKKLCVAVERLVLSGSTD